MKQLTALWGTHNRELVSHERVHKFKRQKGSRQDEVHGVGSQGGRSLRVQGAPPWV